jgi:glycosyltransferase involved in cell wall biosynthesis
LDLASPADRLGIDPLGNGILRASVLMTVYNCQSYLKASVESALLQVLEDFEVVVIDDGSTDLTRQILDDFDDPRLTVVHCERMGRARALNFGMARCASPYVAILDADDVALPHRLQSQITYLDANADVVLVGSRYRPFIDKDGTSMSEDIFPLDFPRISDELRQFRCPLFHSSIMFRKEAIRDVGGYDESLATSEDWDLYVRLALAARMPIANIDQRLSLKRIHPKQFFWGHGGAQFSAAGQRSEMTVRERISDLLKNS